MPAFSQSPADQYEVSISDNDRESFQVVPCGLQGVALYRSYQTKAGQVGIEVIRLDTLLRELWKGFIPLDQSFRVHFAVVVQNYLYVLVQNAYNAASKFRVVSILLSKGQFTVYEINNLIPFAPKEFAVTKSAILIGGHFNYRPLVLYFSLASKEAHVLPGFFNAPGELVQMKTDPSGAIDVIVSSKSTEGRRAMWIRNYDPDGNLAKTIVLEPEGDQNLLFGQSVSVAGDEQVVAGVYGRSRDYSHGIFIARINAFGEYKIEYYNYADLPHFFSYMKAKKEQRVKDRIQRRKIKGKKTRFNYRILVHALLPYKDNYVLVGEAFFPTYRYPQGYTYSSIYQPMYFDGYQYTHAVVIGIAKDGKLLWDNSFEINDIRSMELRQFVRINPTSDGRIVLLYLFDNIIRTKVIRDDQVIEGKSMDDLELDSNGKKSKDVEWSQLEYWYDGNFCIFGVQRDKSEAAGGRKFFVSRINYH